MKIKSMIIVTLSLAGFFTSCVSVEDIKKDPTMENDVAIVKIDSVTRESSFRAGNQTLRPVNSAKDDIVVVEASFLNNGTETVTVSPWATGLNPFLEKKYGIVPGFVNFYHAGESFAKGLSGVVAQEDIELPPGEADRRVFAFVYPKDHKPDALNLMVLSADKKPVLWITVPLVFEEERAE